MHTLVVCVWGRLESRCEHQVPIHKLWLHELLEIRNAQTSVPVVSNVTAVHDFPEKIT